MTRSRANRNTDCPFSPSRGSALCNIIRLGRVFRSRLEVSHRQAVPTEDWFFTLQHVGEDGRHFVGKFRDVAVAFAVARAFRNRGIRVVSVDRMRP
jgi:hypothetical protein